MTFEEWWKNPREIPQTEYAARAAFNAGDASRDVEIAGLNKRIEQLGEKTLNQQFEITKLKKDALEFHGQVNRLTEWNNNLVSHRDELLAEIAELVAALEGYLDAINASERAKISYTNARENFTVLVYDGKAARATLVAASKAEGVARAALAKVRKP